MVNGVIIFLGVLLVAYGLGSFPTGYLIGIWLKGIDIRLVGSGSTGATNVLRTLGRGPGLLVFIIDLGKGIGAIALARSVDHLPFTPPSVDIPSLIALSGFLALVGHSKSVWLGFTGGKSVATSLGILLAMNWVVALAAVAVFTGVVGVTRIVSISSISGAIAVVIAMVVLNEPIPYQLFAVIGGTYVIWRHRSNLKRLLKGTEPKLGQQVTTPPH
ncbi:MAG: glycerol-3-phosphate 1-O-acyltransferase PlsY [Cyanobacteria bacterium REEB444]|nr:glycerol-3-phosphate 1-O-acyltransferase PlsY [Cyanobacteria bacterium REEB444]